MEYLIKVDLNLHINELTNAQFDQVLIPLIMRSIFRTYSNGENIEWSFNVSCSDFKVSDNLHLSQKNVNSGEQHE